LGLDDGFELPERANIKKKHPDSITDEDLAEVELGPGVTLATVRLYINKVSPFNHEAYNKNVFLDRCIEELYLECEGKKIKKHGDVERMKKHIEGLEEIAELAEQFGEDGVEENLLEDEGEGGGVKFKPRKTKMCPDMLEKGKCKNGKACKLAHNPIQLELIPVTKKIQNLKGVVATQSRSLSSNQTTEAWIPSSKHIEVDSKSINPPLDFSEVNLCFLSVIRGVFRALCGTQGWHRKRGGWRGKIQVHLRERRLVQRPPRRERVIAI